MRDDPDPPILISEANCCGPDGALTVLQHPLLGAPRSARADLSPKLSPNEVGEEIPEALYEAVAAILREVWEAEEPAPDGADGADSEAS